MAMFNRMFGQKHTHTTDSPELIRQNIAEGKAVMLDVRSQEEFDAGHLNEVIFISIDEIRSIDSNTDTIEVLDKTKIVYCH